MSSPRRRRRRGKGRKGRQRKGGEGREGEPMRGWRDYWNGGGAPALRKSAVHVRAGCRRFRANSGAGRARVGQRALWGLRSEGEEGEDRGAGGARKMRWRWTVRNTLTRPPPGRREPPHAQRHHPTQPPVPPSADLRLPGWVRLPAVGVWAGCGASHRSRTNSEHVCHIHRSTPLPPTSVQSWRRA